MTRHDQILAKLRAFRPRMELHWVTNGELMQPDAGGGDWRRRIHELRDRGHVIVMKRDPKNARLTHWAWLGVLRETPAEADGIALALTSPGHTLITCWKREVPDPTPGYYYYRTIDMLDASIREEKTRSGGTMHVAY